MLLDSKALTCSSRVHTSHLSMLNLFLPYLCPIMALGVYVHIAPGDLHSIAEFLAIASFFLYKSCIHGRKMKPECMPANLAAFYLSRIFCLLLTFPLMLTNHTSSCNLCILRTLWASDLCISPTHPWDQQTKCSLLPPPFNSIALYLHVQI